MMMKKTEGRDIGRIGDREGVDRRQEEEIVAERRRDAGDQRRPQAEAHGDADDRRQKYQIDIFDAEPGLDQLARCQARRATASKGDDVGPRIERARETSACAPSSSGSARSAMSSPAMT